MAVNYSLLFTIITYFNRDTSWLLILKMKDKPQSGSLTACMLFKSHILTF